MSPTQDGGAKVSDTKRERLARQLVTATGMSAEKRFSSQRMSLNSAVSLGKVKQVLLKTTGSGAIHNGEHVATVRVQEVTLFS